MVEKIKSEDVDHLIEAFMLLETDGEYYKFFDDLCTVAEIKEMSKRLRAAKMLKDGVVYNEISEATGLSTATISRVSKCLKYGSDGYSLVLEKLERLERQEKQEKQERLEKQDV
jgi:TrpR-related protein YerC/YecD